MITVANKRVGAIGEYIGRPSPLGNPFAIGRDGTRDEVIAKYREWLYPLLDESKPSQALTEMNRLTESIWSDVRCWRSTRHPRQVSQARTRGAYA